MFKTKKSRLGLSIVLMIATLCLTSVPSIHSHAADTVTLTFFHWKGGDAGPTIDEINKAFEAANPNVKIEFESAPTDQYAQILPTRLAANDAPDILGVFPGQKLRLLSDSGYLMDLSDQAWVSRINAGAKSSVMNNGKVYALPLDQNVIGVVYNKKIFKDVGLSVPTTWEAFLKACDTLKAKSVIPVALGNKDQWVSQLIPYAMAPSAIYSGNPDFDVQVSAGKASFGKSAWTTMMADYLDMNSKGYFNAGVLGTTYDQTVQLIATGKAAMVVNGNWIIAPIRAAAPDLDLGMFALPYSKLSNGTVWVPGAVGATIGASATTKHPNEVKAFIAFWAQQDSSAKWLVAAGALPVLNDVTPKIDPAAAEMIPALNKGSYPFLDQNWPQGVQETMTKDIQGVFSQQITTEQMLKDMDSVWQAAIAQKSAATAVATASK